MNVNVSALNTALKGKIVKLGKKAKYDFMLSIRNFKFLSNFSLHLSFKDKDS